MNYQKRILTYLQTHTHSDTEQVRKRNKGRYPLPSKAISMSKKLQNCQPETTYTKQSRKWKSMRFLLMQQTMVLPFSKYPAQTKAFSFVATCGKLHNFYNHKKIVTTMLLYLLDTCFSFSNSFLTL
jgi:hypothetical protein